MKIIIMTQDSSTEYESKDISTQNELVQAIQRGIEKEQIAFEEMQERAKKEHDGEETNKKQIQNKELKMTPREAQLLKGMRIYPYEAVITNPYSGERVKVCGAAAALYDVMLGCQIAPCPKSQRLYLAARDVFLRNFPNEYMLLID